MNDTILMVWDGSKGGRSREKAVPSSQVDAYIKYGWILKGVAHAQVPIAESVPILPTFTDEELEIIAESTKRDTVVKQENKKRGRQPRNK